MDDDHDSARDLLVRGMAAAKSGDHKEARFYLEWLLRLDPPQNVGTEAWYWLSEASDDPAEQRRCLEEILANNLGDARARRKLAILDGKIDPEAVIDPDNLAPAEPGEAVASEARRFTCPTCGGKMVFTPDGQSLTCEYCENRQRVASGNSSVENAENFVAALATLKGHLHPVTQHLLICQGCGASFIVNPSQLAETCPYCASAYILKQDQTREVIIPDGVIPFKVNLNQARHALVKWFKESGFVKLPRVAPGRGIYLPAWSFNLGGQVQWRGYVYKNKQQQLVSGLRLVSQYDLLVPASRSLPEALHPAFSSYDLGQLAPYDDRYLANWVAETYQVSVADASLDARQHALMQERQLVQAEVNTWVNDLVVDSSQMIVNTFRLLLLPAWLASYKIEDKGYQVLINGQNSLVFAEKPAASLGNLLSQLLK